MQGSEGDLLKPGVQSRKPIQSPLTGRQDVQDGQPLGCESWTSSHLWACFPTGLGDYPTADYPGLERPLEMI